MMNCKPLRQIVERVDAFAVYPELEVEMRSRGITGRAYLADLLAFVNALADLYQRLRSHVGVERFLPVVVPDYDVIAV